MRDLIISFNGGEVISGLNEKRNYYFFELENIERLFLKNYKASKKPVHKNILILLEGEILYRGEFLYSGESITNAVLKLLDHKKGKVVQGVIDKEKQYLDDDKFKSFLIRYDEVLCSPDRPIPFFMDIDKSYRVFKQISEKVRHLFYSKLSVIIRSLAELNNLVIKMIQSSSPDTDLQYAFSNFLDNDKNFGMYCNYVPTRLLSLSPDRINALYPNYIPYQRYQDILFKHLVFYFGFSDVHNTHLQLLERFDEEFHLKLFNGNPFLDDEDFSIKIFNPVINNFLEKSIEKANKLVEEQGLDESIIRKIYEF